MKVRLDLYDYAMLLVVLGMIVMCAAIVAHCANATPGRNIHDLACDQIKAQGISPAEFAWRCTNDEVTCYAPRVHRTDA